MRSQFVSIICGMQHRSFKGSALGMAIIIALLMAFVSGFFVLKTHLAHMSELHYNLRERLMQNSSSGIQFLLADPMDVLPRQSSTLDLYDTKLDSVTLTRKTWGALEVIVSNAFGGKLNYTQTALVGGGPESITSRTGLYICDLGRPIQICGNTVLKGNTYLPDEGLKRAYIEGQNYVGEKLVYGNELISKQDLPEVNNRLVLDLNVQLNGRFANEISTLAFYEWKEDSITSSFTEPTLVLNAGGTLSTGKHIISGNVILHSSGNVIVNASSNLQGTVIYAPEVEIESGFEGNIQVFASKRILVNEGVKLNYPSVIGLLSPQPDSTEAHTIILEENCVVNGTVFALRMTEDTRNKIRVTSSNGFEMKGELYVDGDLDLKGKVEGSVWCRKIVLKTPSALYENHLLNVMVDPTVLSKHYLGTALFLHKKRSILQWL
jgi:cytoskeletal protein CcmA (bactofilin family)